MNIALVDDVTFETDRIKFILKNYAAANRMEFEVDSFSSGEEFLSAYEPFRYSIIFMDIYMEGISGVEVARRLRALDHPDISHRKRRPYAGCLPVSCL